MHAINFERGAYLLFLLTLAASQISIAGTYIAFGFCALFFLIHLLQHRPPLSRSGLELPYLSLLAILLVASVLSEQTAGSLFNLRKLGLIVFLYAALWLINTRQRLLWAQVVLMLTLALTGLLEIIHSGWDDARLRWAGHGVTVTYGVVIMMSLFMLLAVRRSLRAELRSLILPELFLEKYDFGLLLLVIMAAFVLAGVRSAFVGFAAGFFVLAMLQGRRLFLYFLVVAVLALLLSPPVAQERLLDFFKIKGDLSNEGRLLLWQTGWRIFLAHPWRGWGWRDLAVVYPDFAPAGADLTKHPFYIGHVHNNFLQMSIIGGIAGLGVFIWLWVEIGRKLFSAFRQMPAGYLRDTVLGAFCAFIGYLFAGLFDWSFGDEEIMIALWLLIGLGFAAERMARVEQENIDSVLGT